MTARVVTVLLLVFGPCAYTPQPGRVAVNVAPAVPTSPARGAKQVRTTADLSRRAPAAAARPTPPASRSWRRPPLAEETRWRSLKPRSGSRSPSPASGSAPTASHAATAAILPSATPAVSDLQRARDLPEPWRSIVRCESLGDGSWRVGSSSRARGWFQFLRSTWRSLGMSGDPAAASFDTQYAAARRLARRDGLRAWSCARILGLS